MIGPRFDISPEGYVDSFSDGLAMAKVDKKYGYIDHSGDFVIEPRFLHGTGFQEGLARVVVEGPCRYFGDGPCPDSWTLGEGTQDEEAPACKFTFIDKLGSIITAERFDYAKDFSEELAPVRKGRKWGFIDRKGQSVIEPRFDAAEPFSEGLARVQQGKLYRYIDNQGEYIIAPQYEYADSFSDGLAVVSDSRGKQGFKFEYFY